ncbi:MAG: hypothetical protein ABFS45_08185 [Pseudomonadota bacterium]
MAAYESLGYEVDLFSTWTADQPHFEQSGIRLKDIEFSQRWIAKNVGRPVWRRYAAFSATTEDPLAAAGLLSQLWRRPLITLADEIRSGSYSGNRSRRWKELCRWGMRRSSLTVVNEAERVHLQRDFAGLAAGSPMLVYPGCFRELPLMGFREGLRQSRGIPDDALVLCYSGLMSYGNGGLWLAEALAQCPTLWVWGQLVNLDSLTRGLLERLHGSERLVLEKERMSWQDSWSSMAAMDIGMVIYLQEAPQYRHMGTASNRLCMFLAMGVPVIASRQPSFGFIERYDCGVLVDGIGEMQLAVEKIASRLDVMRANARDCAREYIRAPERWMDLRDALGRILRT